MCRGAGHIKEDRWTLVLTGLGVTALNVLVIENIMHGPMRLLGMGKQEAYDEAKRLLGQVGLKDKAFSFPKELSAERLPSIAREVGASGTIASYTLYVPEGGNKAVVEVDCRGLAERGVDPEQLGPGRDVVSDALVAGYATRAASTDPAVMAYEIKSFCQRGLDPF